MVDAWSLLAFLIALVAARFSGIVSFVLRRVYIKDGPVGENLLCGRSVRKTWSWALSVIALLSAVWVGNILGGGDTGSGSHEVLLTGRNCACISDPYGWRNWSRSIGPLIV